MAKKAGKMEQAYPFRTRKSAFINVSARLARVGISGYGFLDKIHLLDSDSFYFVAGYSWILI